MIKVTILGGTGGLGSQLAPRLSDYEVTALGSSHLNVTNYEEVSNYFKNNPADVVINLSGYNKDSFLHKLTADSQDAVNKQIDVNIKGSINVVSSCLPSMRENGYGRIILMSSVLASKPVVSTGIYSGCKGFLDSLAKTTAIENASKNVTCNTLQLGYFDGGLTYKIPESFRNQVLDTIPAKRWGTIEELENVVRFLINTPYVNGTNLKVNGGLDF